MGTSLPPSPTQAIRILVVNLISLATIAFCLGAHLHTQTDLAC